MSAAATILAELRSLGIGIEVVRGRLRLTPGEAVDDDLRQRLVASKSEILRLLGAGSAVQQVQPVPAAADIGAAVTELRARLDCADRVEAAVRARGEPVPDPDDPTYWDWYDAQPKPPAPAAGPWPHQVVSIRVEENGQIVSGPLCDAEGGEVRP